ncbi:hypothetical protein ACOMHN_047302 [Nucella lapillus]
MDMEAFHSDLLESVLVKILCRELKTLNIRSVKECIWVPPATDGFRAPFLPLALILFVILLVEGSEINAKATKKGGAQLKGDQSSLEGSAAR